jgi:hypothetical protein
MRTTRRPGDATMTTTSREEMKALKKLNRAIDRKRYNGLPLTADELAAEERFARLYCQARANEEGIAWHLTRSADGTVWGCCDRDLEIKREWGMPIPAILETFTRMETGRWVAPSLGSI